MGRGFQVFFYLSGLFYVAFITDVFARVIVGWRVSSTTYAEFVLDALEQLPKQHIIEGVQTIS